MRGGRAATVVLTDTADDEIAGLRALQRTVLRHPVAAQAAFAALVRSGRAYGATPEGARWLARLEGSRLVERLQLVWEAASLGALDPSDDGVVPESLLDVLLTLAARGDLEALLSAAPSLDAGRP